jgi:hypothetical protein
MDVTLDRMKAGIYKFKGVTRVGEDHRLRGRADVHHAHHGLSRARPSGDGDMTAPHPTAIVDPQAQLDAASRSGPTPSSART